MIWLWVWVCWDPSSSFKLLDWIDLSRLGGGLRAKLGSQVITKLQGWVGANIQPHFDRHPDICQPGYPDRSRSPHKYSQPGPNSSAQALDTWPGLHGAGDPSWRLGWRSPAPDWGRPDDSLHHPHPRPGHQLLWLAHWLLHWGVVASTTRRPSGHLASPGGQGIQPWLGSG